MRARLQVLVLVLGCSLFAQNAVYIDLRGEWRQSPGDSADYASPAFDDSSWATTSLPMDNQSVTPGMQASWLRRRITLPRDAEGKPLALTLGAIRRSYEVYANGNKVGSVLPSQHYALVPRPLTFDLPPEAAATTDSTIVIALRLGPAVVSHPYWMLPDEGPYLLTDASVAPRHEGQRQLERRWITVSPSLLFGLVFGVIGALSLLGWWMEPDRRELLWFGIACTVRTFRAVSQTAILLSSASPFDAQSHVWSFYSGNLEVAAFAELVFAALSLGSTASRAAIWILCAAPFACLLFLSENTVIPIGASAQLLVTTLVLGTVAANWRSSQRNNGGQQEWSLLRGVLTVAVVARVLVWTTVLIQLLRAYAEPTRRLEWQRNFLMVGPYWVEYDDVFWLAVSGTLLVLLFRRFQSHRQERHRLANELEAARIVQRLILPGSAIPGVEAVYLPAAEVGGDFWQCYPAGDGGKLLIIVGDVSGKGLKAAMVVSLVTGVLQNRHSDEPAAVLGELNRALSGKLDGGFVTCCCALLHPDGNLVMANAGHIAPYVAGAAAPVDAGLPLGIVSGAEYTETSCHVGNQQVTFVSDGVVEAANSAGELFGFERTRDISAKSAVEIAEAARAWGQNDDITVVTVCRNKENH